MTKKNIFLSTCAAIVLIFLADANFIEEGKKFQKAGLNLVLTQAVMKLALKLKSE